MTRMAEQDRFLALVEEHKRILYKVANAYCRNREDRPDLIQDIVLQLWKSFGRFDDRARFSTWMYRIAMNVAISTYRSERRRIHDPVPIDELGLDLAAADRAMEDASDDIRLLHQLIQRLDEMSRALIVLFLDGYDHEEIAEIVGISTSNAATRLHRIKQKLQRDADALQPEPARRFS
jgi:RNA polymerase sigma factor (sigma-70 family)